MAARYWVGGAGNWSSTTKWSASSGGASGASVPTSVDDAIFDANSGGKFVATVDTAQQINSLTITPSAGAGVLEIAITASLTTGNLTTTGTAGNNRIWFRSTTYGISTNLIVNGTVSISDCDFRGVYVTGTSSPISGTRIGNRGECRGITFSTPKTVYWNFAAGGDWESNAWALSAGGGVSTDNFPLPQDTATIVNTGLNTSAVVATSGATPYLSSVDMSARTNAMTFNVSGTSPTCYGNWTNGSGTTLTTANTITFSGGGTQTITSAGKTFAQPITVNTYGGTVQLADALSLAGTAALTVTNGTFDTKGYAVTAGTLASSNSNVRTITLGASTLTLSSGSPVSLTTTTNLTFSAGTSQITMPSQAAISSGGLTFYNVSFTLAFAGFTNSISGANTFNNVTIVAPASAGIISLTLAANQTINGTLTCAGASAVQRVFLQSNTIGTQRTITAAAISATDCDFRDINLAGAASGASPTRAGDCGGNAGITFSAAKTVYWNLAGAQNWSATGWATSSGGTPAINNFPLAQDTAVFNNTGSVTGTITINAAWNIGTFDASGRTSAMTLTTITTTPVVYGDWKFGTGVTSSSTTGTITFAKNGTQTITSNGVQFGCPVTVNRSSSTVQLADALSLNSARTLTLAAGTFDAVNYNVTAGLFSNNASVNTLKMGSGTWTLSGTGTVWSCNTATTFFVGTSTIVLSDTSTSARTFSGGGLYYNKLTIGGTTGTSTLTISGSNTFGELASTKTVAHTILFTSATTTTIGKWSVTGTAGNVVTVGPVTAASAYTLLIIGPANTGIDYLSISYCAVSTSTFGEFYVGTNSTNTAGNTGPIFFTATPAPRTLYWVGGTGNWSSTTKWSTSSGGASGAAIPTSLDAVVFDSASNATAYTATIDAGVTIARCASFTMAGPLLGNVTFAGTVPVVFHGNVSFAATGITRTYTGTMNWAGNGSYTFTSNGVLFSQIILVTGINATWSLGSALDDGVFYIDVKYGTFSTSSSNYSLTCSSIQSLYSTVRNINLNASSVVLSSTGQAIGIGTTTNLNFNAGTSQITIAGSGGSISSGGLTFYDVIFSSTGTLPKTINGVNTFNSISFPGILTVGVASTTIFNNQTIGTLTLNAGTAAAYRTFLTSGTIGTQVTLSVGTLTAGAADVDFQDIAITGAAAPLTGTRFGDCKGNSGITFPAAKTVYWNLAGSNNWSATAWATSLGGAPAANNFPLAQDTAVFGSASPGTGQTVTINVSYNIGTIDMSARTANTIFLSLGVLAPIIYGNWINGTGTTISGTGTVTFAGRTSQTFTLAGQIFPPRIFIQTPGGSVTLQDSLNCSATGTALTVSAGTFDANGFNVDLTDSSGVFSSTNTNIRTIAVGSGTWTILGSGVAWSTATSTNLTVTGTGTLSFTSALSKTFSGGGANYSGITIDQNGSGALTITGNNTFKTITSSYIVTNKVISLGGTTQTLTSPWTATGVFGSTLTISGTSAASPATLVFTGVGTAASVNYLTINNVRAFPVPTSWYAGTNSTNNGSLGWYFEAATPIVVTNKGNFFFFM